MLKASKRSGRWYSRRRFRAIRAQVLARDGATCPIDHTSLYDFPSAQEPFTERKQGNGKPPRFVGAIDHIWPEKFCRRAWKGCNPHIPDNLICISKSVHSRKTNAEIFLYAGDGASFFQAMDRIGYPRALFHRAAEALAKSVQNA